MLQYKSSQFFFIADYSVPDSSTMHKMASRMVDIHLQRKTSWLDDGPQHYQMNYNSIYLLCEDGRTTFLPISFLMVVSPFLQSILSQSSCFCKLSSIYTISLPSASDSTLKLLVQILSKGETGRCGGLDVTMAKLREVQDVLSLLGSSVKLNPKLDYGGEVEKRQVKGRTDTVDTVKIELVDGDCDLIENLNMKKTVAAMKKVPVPVVPVVEFASPAPPKRIRMVPPVEVPVVNNSSPPACPSSSLLEQNANDKSMEFSNDQAKYNMVTCMACMSVVKVHHLGKHLLEHEMNLAEYRIGYGELQYVKKIYHKCGVCMQDMLFDLKILHKHVISDHQMSFEEYIAKYLDSVKSKQLPVQIENISRRVAMKSTGGKSTARKSTGGKSTARKSTGAGNSAARKSTGKGKYATSKSIGSFGKFDARNLSIQKDFEDHGDCPPLKLQHLSAGNQTESSSFNFQPDDENFNRNIKTDAQNNTTEVLAQNAPKGKVPNCYNTKYIDHVQEHDKERKLISNDFVDYVLVECKLCQTQTPMTRLRSHTKSEHKMTITEYKAQFGATLVPVETVYHKCGLCGKLVLFDSDHISDHLRRAGHMTHKEYNDGFMVDTRLRKVDPRLRK